MIANDGLSEDSLVTNQYSAGDSFTFSLTIEEGSTDGSFTPELSKCDAFALLFPNTCTSGPIDSHLIEGANGGEVNLVTCTGGVTWCVDQDSSEVKRDTCYHN